MECLPSCLNPAKGLHHWKCPHYDATDEGPSPRYGIPKARVPMERVRNLMNRVPALSEEEVTKHRGHAGMAGFELERSGHADMTGAELQKMAHASSSIVTIDQPDHPEGKRKAGIEIAGMKERGLANVASLLQSGSAHTYVQTCARTHTHANSGELSFRQAAMVVFNLTPKHERGPFVPALLDLERDPEFGEMATEMLERTDHHHRIVSCEHCGKNMRVRSLIVHQAYFCGPLAVLDTRQSKHPSPPPSPQVLVTRPAAPVSPLCSADMPRMPNEWACMPFGALPSLFAPALVHIAIDPKRDKWDRMIARRLLMQCTGALAAGSSADRQVVMDNLADLLQDECWLSGAPAVVCFGATFRSTQVHNLAQGELQSGRFSLLPESAVKSILHHLQRAARRAFAMSCRRLWLLDRLCARQERDRAISAFVAMLSQRSFCGFRTALQPMCRLEPDPHRYRREGGWYCCCEFAVRRFAEISPCKRMLAEFSSGELPVRALQDYRGGPGPHHMVGYEHTTMNHMPGPPL